MTVITNSLGEFFSCFRFVIYNVCIATRLSSSPCYKCRPVVSPAGELPLLFSTVHLYLPKIAVTDWAIVSTVSYSPVTVLVTACVCWYVVLMAIVDPSFVQVTVVAGPPVEVQVRDLVVSLYSSVVAVGAPKQRNNSSCSKFSSWKFLDVQRQSSHTKSYL